jgi:hypothetical protein
MFLKQFGAIRNYLGTVKVLFRVIEDLTMNCGELLENCKDTKRVVGNY